MKLLERTVKRTHKKHNTEELAKLPVILFHVWDIIFTANAVLLCVLAECTKWQQR